MMGSVTVEPVVFLNGEFVKYGEARIGVEDRGYQFSDGIYEVIRVYDGKMVLLDEHLERLLRSAKAIGLPALDIGSLRRAAVEVVRRNALRDCIVYIQVTRGVCPRRHQYPEGLTPTIVMMAQKIEAHPPELRHRGVSAILVGDERWSRCYIKSTSLLANVLAKQKAHRSGCFEAIFVRDGFVTEGTSANVFVVENGSVVTPPLSNYILPGITRRTVLRLATQCGILCLEEPVEVDRLLRAPEVFLTGTTTEVMPVVEVDGRAIGDGRPGPVALRLFDCYANFVRRCGESIPGLRE